MDLAQIRHMATLAELTLSEDEEKRFAAEVGTILAYVAELEALDTTDVPPTAHFNAPSRSEQGWREDAVREGLTHEDALSQAPHAEHGGFAVPGFVD